MKIEPLTGVIGARITGIDLQNVDESAAKELRENICRHQVVVIPDQSLSPKEQTEFSHQLGPYSPVPFVQPIPNHPEVIKILEALRGLSIHSITDITDTVDETIDEFESENHKEV